MGSYELLLNLALAVGLGLLVGMQRERVNSGVAGVRTYALLTLLGALSAVLGQHLGDWIVGVTLAGVILFAMACTLTSAQRGEYRAGITSEVAIVLMFCVGAMLIYLPREIPVIVTGAVTLLLYLKVRLHGLIRRFSEDDVRGIMQFVLIALIILPVLPDQAYGPYRALNPFDIWRIVVLVVGMSLLGYVALRVIGARASVAAGGLLGGLVSSTATTVSVARRAAAGHGDLAASAIIVIASAVVYGRVIVEVSVAAPSHVLQIATPIAVLLGLAAATGLWSFLRVGRDGESPPAPSNPTELKSALVFGAVYAIVLLAAAAGQDYFGRSGMFVVAGISGLTDMDAITLSTARLTQAGELPTDTAWRAIVIASMSNLIFKLGLVTGLGRTRLALRVLPYFGVQLAGALLMLWLWPGLPPQASAS